MVAWITDSGNTSYTGVPVTIVTGYMVPLGLFLACGSSAAVRIKHEGGAAAWVVGSLAVPNVQGHQLPQLQELRPNRIFLASGSWRSGLSGWSFSVAQYIRYLKRPLAGILLCCLAVRCLKGQPLYCSVVSAGAWGERGYSDDSIPTHDSAVSPCLHGRLVFLHRHCPPQSPPS